MKKLILFFFLLTALLSCGDNSQDKATKRICDGFAEKIDVDKERCFKDKEYFKKLRFQSAVAIQIERIKKFNLPDDCAVMVFHGKPNPAQITNDPLVLENWR